MVLDTIDDIDDNNLGLDPGNRLSQAVGFKSVKTRRRFTGKTARRTQVVVE